VQSEQTGDLSTALAKAQAVGMTAIINKTNPHFKNRYADLAAVIEAVRDPLAANGLSVTQTTEVREGGLVLVTTLRHASGQWIASDYPLPTAAKPQELGSALTYARRYSLSALLCIAADEDDDAEVSRTSGQTATTPAPKASPIKPQVSSPPMDPFTGELNPHTLAEAEGTQKWGQAFIAAIKSARDGDEIQAWMDANQAGLDALNGASEKAYAHVLAAINTKRESLKQKVAA
jgi:hypothetical protein